MTVLHRALAAVGALALGLGGALVVAAPASAATLTVVNTNPNGAGSLLQAIVDANAAPGSEITFAVPGSGPWTIDVPNTDPLPTIDESTTITGPGKALLTVSNDGTVASAFAADGCSTSVTSVAISGLTVTGFGLNSIDVKCADLVASDLLLTGNGQYGLAYSSSGTVVNTATITNVSSQTNGGGIFVVASFGATVIASGVSATGNTGTGAFINITDDASVDIGSSDFSGNGAYGIRLVTDGATSLVAIHDTSAKTNGLYGVSVQANTQSTVQIARSDISSNSGGNIVGQLDDATMTVTDTTGNDSPFAGGIGFDLTPGSSLTITDSTFSGNAEAGGGVSLDSATLAVTGSTFSDNGPTTDAGGGFLLDLLNSTDVTIDDSAFTGNTSEYGGGLAAFVDSESTLDITGSRFIGNHAIDCGCGGDGVGGGIYVAGVNGDDSRFTLTDSVVTDNDAEAEGGGLYLDELGFDGAVGPTGGVIVLRTTIDNNTALGGHSGGGVYINNWSWKTDPADPAGSLPAIVFDQTTISNNSATNAGGGLYADKGTDNNALSGILLLQNSTVAGNSAQSAGGGVVMFSFYPDGSLRLAHSTVAGNTSSGLGGVAYVGDGNVTLDHSLIADNGTEDFTATVPLVSDWNLIESIDPSYLPLLGAHDLTGVDPKLGPLANNGGTTKTMLPAPGSPAIDAGNPAITAPPATDQRGLARIINIIDIGAVEAEPLLPNTGSTLAPEPPLIALLLLLTGTAMVAFSRLRMTRAAV